MRYSVCLLVCALMLMVQGRAAEAATRTVCASGCQYTRLQDAIDAASPGDTILLRAGQTFTENVTLRNKHTTSTQFITIRSDASDSSFPAAGIRLIPEGRPGANTSRSALARLVGKGATFKSAPVIKAADGAHHYRLQFLEIDGTANLGYETLVMLGSAAATSLSALPHSIVIDRVWLHGHAALGMKRGVYLNSRSTDILNSYFEDFFHFSDSQAILGTGGPGPYRILNNHLEAAGENIMFGGDDPRISGLVPSDIEIRRNYFTKDLAWRHPILATPARPAGSASDTAGSLSGGTHYFKVVAIIQPSGSTGYSAPSPETAVAVSSGRSARLSWSAVKNASKYRVYRGTTSNGQSRYMEATGTSITYTGSGETSGTPKASGSKWTVKNLFELKNAQRVTLDGNLFEYNWQAGQQGHAILLAPNQYQEIAPWTIVRDITFTNNVVRHVAGVFALGGHDHDDPQGQMVNVTIRNNLFYDVDSDWGGTGRAVMIADEPGDVVFDHNTFDHEGLLVEIDGRIDDFVFTNNIAPHNRYGIKGRGTASGLGTLEYYTPGYVFKANVLAGADADEYPPGNYYPAASLFGSQFVSASTGDYRLASSSPYNNRATDGKDIGAIISDLDTALGAAGPGGGTSEPPPPPPPDDPPTGPLPSGWQTRDIGAVGQPGSASASGTTLTVSGAGADVWGGADAFHYTYTTLSGDGTITAQVSSITGAEAWTKVGVMIRGSTSAGAAHAFMLVSTGKGLAFQRRDRDGGSSVHTSGGSGTAPRWVRLSRKGGVVTASVSSSGASWTTVGSDTIDLPSTALVGLGVSSHDTGRLATGVFDNVRVESSAPEPEDGWQSRDVGSVGVGGFASGTGGSLTVSGAGADVWGTADAFHFVYLPLAGDGMVTAQVSAIVGSEAWTKVGVMIRASTAANAAHGFMLVSTGKGLAFQRRPAAGAQSAHTSGGSGTAPRWVRLTRQGTLVTAYASADGASWTKVGSATIDLPSTALLGVAVSSHDAARLATGSFEHVSVQAGTTAGSDPWQARDIGAAGLMGSTTGSGATLTLRGAGDDVWDTADAFHYAYRSLAGDGSVTAEVRSIGGSEAWTKVGVMLRGSTADDAAHAFMLVSSGKGLAFQRRPRAGGSSAHTGTSGAAPRWVRLTRRGNEVTAYVSATGSSWTTVGRATIELPSTALAGVAVSSHDRGELATGVFEHVSVDDGS
mgnify:FL=1